MADLPLQQNEAAAVVVENANRVLLRLSGNMGSTLTNADGSPNPGLMAGQAAPIRDPDGAVPGSVLVTIQLMSDFGLHPKKVAWLMQVSSAAAALQRRTR
jgi:hypothetical protein